jgi:hypothetical protein
MSVGSVGKNLIAPENLSGILSVTFSAKYSLINTGGYEIAII